MFRRIPIAVMFCFLSGTCFAQTLPVPRPEHSKDDSLFAAGILAFGEGRLQEALGAFQGVSDSIRPGVHSNIAAVEFAMGDQKAAEKEWRRALAMDTASVRARMQLADLFDRQGRTGEAADLFRQVLRRDSTLPAALEGYGNVLVKMHHNAEALPVLARAIAASPRNAALYAVAGTALTKMGKLDSARTLLATSLGLNPSNVPVMVQLGAIYFEKKAYDDAFRLFSIASRLQPWNSDVLYRAGLCREKTEDLDDATDFFRRAAIADTANALAFAHLGSVYFRRKLYDSSASTYKTASVLDPDNAGIFINMGISYSCMDSMAKAIACLRQAIDVMGPAEIGNVYERIGALQLGGEHLREAKNSYRKALLFNSEKPALSFYLGFCCDQLRQFDEARKYYRMFLSRAGAGKAEEDRVAVAKKRLSILGGK